MLSVTLNVPLPKSVGAYDSKRAFCVPCGITAPSTDHSVRGNGFASIVTFNKTVWPSGKP